MRYHNILHLHLPSVAPFVSLLKGAPGVYATGPGRMGSGRGDGRGPGGGVYP